MASGGNSSRNLNKEKGPMHNLLEHVGGDVNYDRSYHEFLQDQFGSDHPSSPNPPLIIPEFDGLNHDPNTTNTNENLSNPPPPSNYFFAGEGEEKQMKSILFRVHMKKTELDGGFFHIQCNYCSKSYKTAKSFGYGTYWAHIKRSHPSEFEKSNNQAQIARYATSGLEIDVLHYCDSVKTLLYELYDEYLTMYGPSLNLPVSQPPLTSGGTSTSVKFQLKGLGYRLFSQRAKKLRTSSSSSVSELDRYLEDTHEFLEEKFSLQVWWKTHQQDYPILAIIAKQILGTPVSTVAVEQEFSAGGNILEPRRSVMSPQSLEMQACVDDWTKAKYRQQELQPEIVNDFFEDDQTTGTEGSD
ncbi:hypothetical protein LWI28_018699 [Acer negundo]|uniref:HAT C-terminal dimerisation domain-containing protein n=1 Tax=Acer negundo TaxID=4023 RepID=A0AAD5IQZ3_ACENE|nr:hypothetical protein LWI28_018699 [Acer negundo]